MNKARMTIRFDHETPNGNRRGSEAERELPVQPEVGQRRGRTDVDMNHFQIEEQDYTFHKPDPKKSRVIPLPVEIQERRPVHENNRPENPRVNGRLAEERRRLEQQDYDHQHSDEWNKRAEQLHIGKVEPEFSPMNEREQDQDDFYDTHVPFEEEDRHQAYMPSEQVTSKDDYGYYRSRKPNSVWKLAGSITGAIVTGLLFGTVVLSMFNGEDTAKDHSTAETNNQRSEVLTPGSGVVQGDIQREDAAVAASVAVSIPQQTFYMLQYGVFSSAERAEQAKGELSQSGLAAYGDASEENRVYAGVSPDREQAKLLSSQLKGEGVELYVREITLPGAQSAVYAGEGAALDIFFEVSGGLAAKLSSLSASLLGLEAPAAVDAETMKTITGLHLQWTDAVKLISAGMGQETGDNLRTMEQEMSEAMTALTEYNKNRSKGHLWEIQAGMMNYIMSQRKLVESL